MHDTLVASLGTHYRHAVAAATTPSSPFQTPRTCTMSAMRGPWRTLISSASTWRPNMILRLSTCSTVFASASSMVTLPNSTPGVPRLPAPPVMMDVCWVHVPWIWRAFCHRSTASLGNSVQTRVVVGSAGAADQTMGGWGAGIRCTSSAANCLELQETAELTDAAQECRVVCHVQVTTIACSPFGDVCLNACKLALCILKARLQVGVDAACAGACLLSLLHALAESHGLTSG